jgi:hypothetical protein
MTKTFAAQLKDWTEKTEANIRKVAMASIQDVLEAAQTPQLAISKGATGFVEGKIPVAEAELINSLTVEGSKGQTAYIVAIAGLEIGGVKRFQWTAPYAMRIEAGYKGTDSLGRSYNQEGRHFVGANAQRFSQFVAAREKEFRD